MSVVGFDIGNENCAIAVAKHGGIDVLLNDESKRETPAVVSFGEKQRFLGSAGAAFATKFPESTISQIKRLIGREYEDHSVQEDLKLLPFKTSKGKHGGVSIHLKFLGKTWTFMPVEILGMLFAHLKHLAEKNLEFPVEDCVIGIPSYFTDLQRREYLNAAIIAGLRPLKLIHDCTAVALGYGMYKTDFSNKKVSTNVVFVDIGQCDTQVTVAAFGKGKMTILAHSFDPNLGGRDFDEVLFSHFATQFKKKYDIKVYSNARASVRLRAACEKLKKVLSANEEAPLSIECLVEEKDLVGFITREEFEKLSAKLLERVTGACRKAVTDSGLSVDTIDTIELVGSGSRIPAVMRYIKDVFGKEPMRTLNGSECVARGCALYCAMLSPTFRVQDYEIKDIFPYSVRLFFDADENGRQEFTPFPKGSEFPSNKAVQYNGNITFCCEVLFTNEMDSAISTTVGHFMISPDQICGEKNVEATCTVDVQLNVHGIVEIASASFLEVMHPPTDNSYQIWPMPMVNKFIKNVAGYKHTDSTQFNSHHAVEPRRSSNRDREKNLSVSENHHFLTTKDEIQNAAGYKHADSTQFNSQHAVEPKRSSNKDREKKLSVSENHHFLKTKNEIQNGAGYKHADSTQFNSQHAVEPRRSSNRDREQKLSVSENYHVLTTRDEIREVQKRAEKFAKQDKKVEKTKEKRNTLESFIYSTRSKLSVGRSYRSVATDSEVENISKILQDTEDWLYKEGDDESEQVYIRKLEDLKKLLYPIEVKYEEEKEKEEAVIALQTCIREYRLAADLPPIQKEKVNYECIQAERCFNQLSQLQDSSTKNDTCAYSTGAIIGITQTLKRRCEGILTSKPSLLKYEEPVDSDLKQNPNDEMQVDN